MRRLLARLAVIGGVSAISAGLVACGQVQPTGTWRAGRPGPVAQAFGTSLSLLADGRALFSGGADQFNVPMSTAEVYDPAENQWSFTPPMFHAHSGGTALSLANGDVLLVGGNDANGPTDAAELYIPSKNLWVDAGHVPISLAGAAAVALADGRALFTGGGATQDNPGQAEAKAEFYDPETNHWEPASPMGTPRVWHVAVLLADGRVLVTGGSSGGRSVRSAEIFNSKTDRWSPAAAMPEDRTSPTAVRLKDGRIMVMGGGSGAPNGYQPSPTVVLYDPHRNSWDYGANILVQVGGEPLVLLDGRVIVLGIVPNPQIATQLGGEVYDPASDNWRALATGPTGPGYVEVRSVMLHDGRVLVMLGNQPYVFDPNGVAQSPRQKAEEPLGQSSTTELLVAIAGILLLLVAVQWLWNRRLERKTRGMAA